MKEIHCPNCDIALSAASLADGWCESCGKKVPKFVLAEVPASTMTEATIPPCWYCQQNPFDEGAEVEVPMHQVTGVSRYINYRTVRYRTLTVKVPRCLRCRSFHHRYQLRLLLGGLLGGLLGIGGAWGVCFGLLGI